MKKIFLIIALLFSVVMTSQQQTSVYKWNAAITYNINDLISLNGVIYKATTSNTNDTPPSANWESTSSTDLLPLANNWSNINRWTTGLGTHEMNSLWVKDTLQLTDRLLMRSFNRDIYLKSWSDAIGGDKTGDAIFSLTGAATDYQFKIGITNELYNPYIQFYHRDPNEIGITFYTKDKFEVTGWTEAAIDASASGAAILTRDWATTKHAEIVAGVGGIGGTIAENQIAFGAVTTDAIEGQSGFTWDGFIMKMETNATGYSSWENDEWTFRQLSTNPWHRAIIWEDETHDYMRFGMYSLNSDHDYGYWGQNENTQNIKISEAGDVNIGSGYAIPSALYKLEVVGDTKTSGDILGGSFTKSGATSDDILLGDGTTTSLAGLGAGNVTAVNTPVLNDFARWTTGTSIEGRSYAETRTDLGLVIGTDVQAFSTILENTTASYTTTAASAIGINSLKETNATHTGDVAGATALTIGADKILESHLKSVNAPTDEYVLTYESTTGDFEWQSAGGGGDVFLANSNVFTGTSQTLQGSSGLFVTNGNNNVGGTSKFYMGNGQGFTHSFSGGPDDIAITIGSLSVEYNFGETFNSDTDVVRRIDGDTRYSFKSIDPISQGSSYTTNTAENGKHIDMTAGTTITLDDQAVTTNDQMHIWNKTGGSLTFAYGTDDAAYQGVLPDLADGQYAWCTLKAANTWSVIVGGAGGGLANVVEDLTPELGGDLDIKNFNILVDPLNSGGIGTDPLGVANSSRLFFFNNEATLRSFDDSTLDIGQVTVEYDYALGLELLFTDFGNSANGSIVYQGYDDKFIIENTDIIDFDDASAESVRLDIRDNSSTATIGRADMGRTTFNTAAGAITYTIPDTLDEQDGATFTIIAEGAGTVTVTTSGTATINGSTSFDVVIVGAASNKINAVQFIHKTASSDDWIAVGAY